MKKDKAQDRALNLFLKAGGNISNKDLAEKVKVNPITIGKWKKSMDWAGKLRAEDINVLGVTPPKPPAATRTRPTRGKAQAKTPPPAKVPAKAPTKAKAKAVVVPPVARRRRGPRAMRKPEVFEQALKIYTEARGNITNTEIAKACGVTMATVAKWKKMPQWKTPVAEMPRGEVKAEMPTVSVEPYVAPVTTVDLRRVMENLTTLNKTLEQQIMGLVETKAQVLMGIQQCEMALRQMKG